MMVKQQELEEEQDYFLAIKKSKDEYIIYESNNFKLSEIDIINLIKICLIERRSKSIGKKVLEVYRDSTDHKKDLVKEKLKLIGVEHETEPTTTRKPTKK